MQCILMQQTILGMLKAVSPRIGTIKWKIMYYTHATFSINTNFLKRRIKAELHLSERPYTLLKIQKFWDFFDLTALLSDEELCI